MIILIDGMLITKPRGMGRYVYELLCSLNSKVNNDFKVIVYIPKNTSIDIINDLSNISFIYKKKWPFPIWEQFVLPFYIMKTKCDIVHFPYNTKPLIFNIGLKKHVVTIHDMMFMESNSIFGKNIYQKLGNIYRKYIVKLMRLKSQHIITISKYSQYMIKKYLGGNSDVVYTSMYITSKVYKPIVKGKYFYHVGGISPHKNTERCINAFIKANIEGYKLYISGMPKESYLSKKYAQYNNIKFTGFLKQEEMYSMYANATALIFPSLMEGFGLPITEAMMLDVPIITSNIPPMNEIAGNAALLVNPYSEEEIVLAIRKVLNINVRINILKYSRERRFLFSRFLMGKKMMNLYLKYMKNDVIVYKK